MKNKEENSILDGIKRIAYDNINHSTEIKLIKWWTKKYNLPPTDDRLLAYTFEELLIEYYEDLFLDKPEEMSSMTPKKEIEEITQEDDRIPDINPILAKKGKQVDLSKFKVNDNVENNSEHS